MASSLSPAARIWSGSPAFPAISCNCSSTQAAPSCFGCSVANCSSSGLRFAPSLSCRICCSSLPSGFPVIDIFDLVPLRERGANERNEYDQSTDWSSPFRGIIMSRPWYSGEMRFEFATARRILFGEGVVRDVPAAARIFGRRAILVRGSSAERAAGLRAALEAAGVNCPQIAAPGGPTVGLIRPAPRDGDLLVAIGGGTAGRRG